MQFIPPKDRFSRHSQSLDLEPSLLSAAVSRFDRSPDDATFQRLAGGFMNANFLASVESERFVVRVYSTDRATAERECDLLTFLASHPVLVPKVLASFQVEDRPVAILEFVDGMTLEDRLSSGESVALSLYRDIGVQLARIHRITFPEAGVLDLASMASFLARPEDYQESFRTARVVIESTLVRFGY